MQGKNRRRRAALLACGISADGGLTGRQGGAMGLIGRPPPLFHVEHSAMREPAGRPKRSNRAMAERMEVLFSGTVQGVGFRYATLRAAAALAVTGFVTNLPDGRVRLVAEGEPAELADLLAMVEQAMGGYIRSREVRRGPATGAFAAFGVR